MFIPVKIQNRVNRFFHYPLLKRKNVKIEKRVFISSECIFEGYNVIGSGSYINASYIGTGTYMGNNCIIKNTKIGRYCSIASSVKIVDGNHPTSKYVSTHPVFYSDRCIGGLQFKHITDFEEHSYTNVNRQWLCEIGNDVWIGENVLIMNGCVVGDGAVIASGAVVSENIEPYTIVAGVPAKVKKKRFANEDIDFLLNIKWWNKEYSWLKSNIDAFDDIQKMREIITYEANRDNI